MEVWRSRFEEATRANHFEFTNSDHRQPARWLSSTRLKIRRLISPGQPAVKNRPITGRFHFLIPWRLPFKIIKLKCPRQNSFTRGISSNKRMKLDQGTGFVPGPLMFRHTKWHSQNKGSNSLTECQLSRNLTAKQPDQNEADQTTRGSRLHTLGSPPD